MFRKCVTEAPFPGSTSESVSRAKTQRLKLTIRDFLSKHSGIVEQYDSIRVDLVCVSGTGDPASLEFRTIKGIIEF